MSAALRVLYSVSRPGKTSPEEGGMEIWMDIDDVVHCFIDRKVKLVINSSHLGSTQLFGVTVVTDTC
jgi:hypothetical protein